MIHIETTAEFDAAGRFNGRISEPVTPGVHLVGLTIEEQPLLERQAPQDVNPVLVQRDGLLLIDALPRAGAQLDINDLIRFEREGREQQLLGGEP